MARCKVYRETFAAVAIVDLECTIIARMNTFRRGLDIQVSRSSLVVNASSGIDLTESSRLSQIADSISFGDLVLNTERTHSGHRSAARWHSIFRQTRALRPTESELHKSSPVQLAEARMPASCDRSMPGAAAPLFVARACGVSKA